MKIQEFMTTRIEFVAAESTVYDAIEKMADRRIRSLVVTYPGGEDHGVITARDIIFRVLAEKKDPNRVKVSEIASKPIVCVDQETDFLEVAEMMKQNNIARVFVCDEKGITGVVALLDVMNATLIMRARGENGS
jgi:signal-transduction protein with cAMP-binding, CBS, and nucleotidyltransferase domain